MAIGAMVTLFQSTLSMRRATGSTIVGIFSTAAFQSTLSMRRATIGCNTVEEYQ